jgi:hypothetical protein
VLAYFVKKHISEKRPVINIVTGERFSTV